MSLNANRFARATHPLIIDPRVIYPDLEGDAELAREASIHAEVEALMQMVDTYRAEVEQQQAQHRTELRNGKGVAWVADLGYEVRRDVPKKAEPRRGVVVMQNHKFCWIQLP